MLKRRFSLLVVGILTLASAVAEARVQIQMAIEPKESRNGEPVRFKIRVESDQGAISAPVPPTMTDWEITGSYESRSRGTSMVNGRFTTMSRAEFTYILKPLKKGALNIPAFRIQAGNDVRSTATATVLVQNLPGGAAQRPRLQAGPRPQAPNPFATNPFGTPTPPSQLPSQRPQANANPNQPSGPTQPDIPSAANEPLPENQTFFLRAEPDKLTAYVGEIITVSYALYQRQMLRLEDPSFAKFPDFKGFLKEELEMPRKFIPVPVQLQGETLYRSEMLKYAIFPLKPGNVIVQPMVFRATVYPSQADILNSIMNGTMPPSMGEGLPMEKSSKELRMTIKPIPMAPAGMPFSGAVGQFEMELKGPIGKLHVDQPFTITLTIAGFGNVKSIEEPVLDLPKGLEPYQTKNQYEFRSDASGYKSFEFLLLPRQGGRMSIPALTWGYFDPRTEQFKTLQTQPLELNIEGSANPIAEKNDEKKPDADVFSPWDSGPQEFMKVASIGAPSPLSGPVGWSAQLVAYLGALVLFLRRKRQADLESFYANAPWAKTERAILAQKEWDNKELAILVDQWIRERLWDVLDDPELNTESARDDFTRSLKARLHVEHQKSLPALQQVWTDLDVLRFTGAKSQRTTAKPYLDQAKKAVEPLVKALPAPSGPAATVK